MSEEIKIEKGIPLPKKSNYSELSKVMASMAIGDSFIYNAKSYGQLAMSSSRAGIKITVRKQSPGVYRIWRIG